MCPPAKNVMRQKTQMLHKQKKQKAKIGPHSLEGTTLCQFLAADQPHNIYQTSLSSHNTFFDAADELRKLCLRSKLSS